MSENITVTMTVCFRGLPDIDTALDSVRKVIFSELCDSQERLERALEAIGTDDVTVSFTAR